MKISDSNSQSNLKEKLKTYKTLRRNKIDFLEKITLSPLDKYARFSIILIKNIKKIFLIF